MKSFPVHDAVEPLCPYCRAKKFPGLRMPQHQAGLNKTHCNDPTCGCTHLDIGNAHGDGADAEYCKKHGILTLVCHHCGGLIDMFAIAEKLTMVPAKSGPYILVPKGSWDGETVQ